MKWKLKALLHRTLPYLPYHKDVHYWIQRRLTEKLPRSRARYKRAQEYAELHIGSYQQHVDSDISTALLYDIGAGWDLTIQLFLFAFGVERQVTVDRCHLCKADLINDSISRMKGVKSDYLKRFPENFVTENLNSELSDYYGIDYRAPYDARQAHFEDNVVDLITCTETMSYIPIQDLRAILGECHRVLKPSGIMSIYVNLEDNYSYLDNTISVYNFLQYSPSGWSLYCPSSYYQNRLRFIDYVHEFENTGFEIVESHHTEVTEAAVDLLKTLSIAHPFTEYSWEELAIRAGRFVLAKREIEELPEKGTPAVKRS